MVTELDRLACSVRDAQQIADDLAARQLKLSIVGSVYDPTDPMGKLLFNGRAMVAEFSAIWTRRDGRLPQLSAAAW